MEWALHYEGPKHWLSKFSPIVYPQYILVAISKSGKVTFLRYIGKSREWNNNECLFLRYTPVRLMTVSFNWILLSLGAGEIFLKTFWFLQKLSCPFPNLWDSASIAHSYNLLFLVYVWSQIHFCVLFRMFCLGYLSNLVSWILPCVFKIA